MVKTLGDASGHGFARDEFIAADVLSAIRPDDPHASSVLAPAILAYARAQHGGRIRPGAFPAEWAVRPAAYDPQPEFAAALDGDRLGPWLDGLAPSYEGYQALRQALSRYRTIANRGGWKAVPAGPPLALGANDPRVAALRRRLLAEDPATPSAPDPNQFDQPLATAVIRFQRRYGLAPDGVAGAPTLAALNAPVGQRILQIQANMERWRWLPRELPASRIQVNIAAAVMAVYQNGQPTLAMKAVAGKPDDATPMLSSQVQSIVLNPPWHVPESIAKKEIWPKAQRDKGYLARNQYVVRKAEDGSLRLVQKSGPKSALGRYKFDFVNPFGVYLHDTPAQAGFSRTSRLSSHGCVRLEHPKLLANLLLDGDAAWPPERIDKIVATDDTVRAPLPQPMPVFLLYWTAFVDEAGQVEFRNDAYDWDRKLLDLIVSGRSRA